MENDWYDCVVGPSQIKFRYIQTRKPKAIIIMLRRWAAARYGRALDNAISRLLCGNLRLLDNGAPNYGFTREEVRGIQCAAAHGLQQQLLQFLPNRLIA